MIQKDKLPNFLIAGAPRCGSTTLFRALQHVPGVFMPENKEPHYFAADRVGSGPGQEGGSTVVDLSDYLSLFSGPSIEGANLRGECSIGYLHYWEYTIERILKELGPDVKVIFTLREPVRRAYSSYLLHRKVGSELLSFSDAVSNEVEGKREREQCWFGFQYRKVGLYADGIKAFKEAFSNVHVVIFEEFVRDPKLGMSELLKFLEVESCEVDFSFLVKQHNAALIDRFPFFVRALNSLGRRLPFSDHVVQSMIKLQKYRPRLSSGLEDHLRKYYKADVARLEEVTGKDLSLWGY